MDNDNKIKKNQLTTKTHDEVLLFLNDELKQIQQSSEFQSYNLEKEYEKTKEHKSPFTYVVLAICFLCVSGIAFIMNAVISKHNSEIAVSLQVFDDLNLQTLLDSVSKVKISYDDAVQRKLSLVSKMEQELSQALGKKDNDLFVLESLKISKKEKSKRISLIENEYKSTISSIHQEYDPQISTIEVEIKTYSEQLAEFDNAKVEAAREQEKAFEAERQVYEIEKEKIKKDYESRIKDLNTSISSMQTKHDYELRNSIGQLNAAHQRELETYDPVIKDSVADEIVKNARNENSGDFDVETLKSNVLYTNKKVENALNSFQKYYSDYSYLDSKYKTLPYKHSVVDYRNASNLIVNQMGDLLTQSSFSFAEETNSLKSEIKEYKNQLVEAEENLNKELEWFEDCLEGILGFAKTNAIVLQMNSSEDIAVYIAEKARYLITEEKPAEAEIRTEKALRGKIYKDVFGNGEDDYFYFVPNPDKNGNPVEFDYSLIVPGTAVKILSK